MAIFRPVVLGGSGDAYLICALVPALRAHYGTEVKVVLRSRLAAVARLFPDLEYEVNEALVDNAEQDHGFQKSHPNDLFLNGSPYYAHPSFTRTPFRVDWMTTKPDASQADMYRMMLGLPPTAPLALPTLPSDRVERGTVVIIEDSTSWPNTQPTFWPKLADALKSAGWSVAVNDKSWSLDGLLTRCAKAEWVIGPQCGVVSILVTGQFPCRKTLATPAIDGNRRPEYLAPETFPYAYVTKFANTDFDIEEFKIEDDNHASLVKSILTGSNARRLRPHDPSPVMSVMMPLAVGDFLDRLAVLLVKHKNFSGPKRAAIERERLRYVEACRQLSLTPEVETLFGELIDIHERTYELHAKGVPAALGDDPLTTADTARLTLAVQYNRDRMDIRAKIDELCHSPYTDIKDYFDAKAAGL